MHARMPVSRSIGYKCMAIAKRGLPAFATQARLSRLPVHSAAVAGAHVPLIPFRNGARGGARTCIRPRGAP